MNILIRSRKPIPPCYWPTVREISVEFLYKEFPTLPWAIMPDGYFYFLYPREYFAKDLGRYTSKLGRTLTMVLIEREDLSHDRADESCEITSNDCVVIEDPVIEALLQL